MIEGYDFTTIDWRDVDPKFIHDQEGVLFEREIEVNIHFSFFQSSSSPVARLPVEVSEMNGS